MPNAKTLEVASLIAESFENETGELPEEFVRLGVSVSCPADAAGDETFDAAIEYLLGVGLLRSAVKKVGENAYVATLRNA